MPQCSHHITFPSAKLKESAALLALVSLNPDDHRIGPRGKFWPLCGRQQIIVLINLMFLLEKTVAGTVQTMRPEDTEAGEVQGDQEAVLVGMGFWSHFGRFELFEA